MRNVQRIVLLSVIFVILLLVAGVTLTVGWRPLIGPKSRPATSRRFEATPERLQRGKYLATALTGCLGCHSAWSYDLNAQTLAPGKEFIGQVMPFEGLPGLIVAPNLTADAETGLGAWSDDEIARAIREGVGRDGRALFPMMPYENFRQMSDEDVASVVVFLRTLPAVRNPLPPTEPTFPVKYLIRVVPQPVEGGVAAPDRSDPVQYGKYLITMASCEFCHTASERGALVPGMAFAGGAVFKMKRGAVASANITPDASGIGYYDEALFFQAMRTGVVKARKLNPLMPYGEFKDLTDDDLKAMFAYLKTVKPVKHRVDNSETPTQCKLDKQMHGAGDQN